MWQLRMHERRANTLTRRYHGWRLVAFSGLEGIHKHSSPPKTQKLNRRDKKKIRGFATVPGARHGAPCWAAQPETGAGKPGPLRGGEGG